MLDQPTARIVMRCHGLERHPDPFPGLLPERDAGKQFNDLSADTEFVEGHNPSGPDEIRGRTDEGDGIGLVNQDISADHRIEGLGVGKGLHRDLLEVDVSELGRPCSSPGDSDDFLAAIDPDDRPGFADQLGGEHRDVAGAEPRSRTRMPWPIPAPAEALGDRPAGWPPGASAAGSLDPNARGCTPSRACRSLS